MSIDLFKTIDKTIQSERLYAEAKLMREDVMNDFDIWQHRMNEQHNTHAGSMTFPQYINAICLEVAYDLLTDYPEKTISKLTT